MYAESPECMMPIGPEGWMDDESCDSRISSDDAHVMCGAKTSLNGKFTEILSDINRYYEILSDVIRYY